MPFSNVMPLCYLVFFFSGFDFVRNRTPIGFRESDVCLHLEIPQTTINAQNNVFTITAFISTNNRINSEISQQHTPFVDQSYCGREVLFEKVGSAISCRTETGNRVKHGQFWQGTCGEDAWTYDSSEISCIHDCTISSKV